ncbi:hypothetical protein [Streptomyces buecherae]|uniref:Uncharacterized protein n=1 Tax=Streptomyces buecherae TaxID=2763006 RepID=A0A7H8NA26_9ACTN|nr:hypothetical protein [Streptomyces buecherae]QKW51293.1 hypothetical protein HUT08_19090 [Streptomyces buecherae]
MIDLDWSPPAGGDVVLLPAGCQWDAVRTSTAIADAAFQILDGTENCAAIIDPRTGWVYWLLPPGALAEFAHWERLEQHVSLIAAGDGTHYVGVPPSHRRTGPGLHWRITGEWSGRYLAQPYYLGAVLTSAVVFAHGPEALPAQCELCERELEPAHAVTVHGRRGLADAAPRPLTVHPACARTARLRASSQEPRP